jgi:hypothetical protein
MLILHSWNWYLYLDRDGGHCILGSTYNFQFYYDQPSSTYDDLSDTSDRVHIRSQRLRKQEKLQAALTTTDREVGCEIVCDAIDFDLQLHATSFEEFLVRTYYEEWATWFTDDEPGNLPDPLKEYLVHVFSEKGRCY